MLRSWSRSPWRGDDDTEAGRMLDLQVRLGNVERIDEFLAELSADGHYAVSDNGAIVRAAALLPPPRATELLVRIVRRNARGPSQRLRRSAAALRRGADGCGRRPGADRRSLDRRLAGRPGADAEELAPGTRPTPVRPGFVVDVLTATSRIDAGLAARAIEHLLAWPKTYKPDAVLVPAALAFAKLVETTAWPAVGRLREASLDHLRRRIALPLEAPRDWSRTNPLKCTCGDCRGLGAFLVDA